MPFAGYKDFADCVAKNQDKDDPEAYCAVIKRQVEDEAYRHPDFDKIYKQFLAHIKDEEQAASRYYGWIQALNLDETKSYDHSMREQFRWVKRHKNFELWKEDGDAKYWQVEAAFPLESMNRNVYTERELQESARTLRGKQVNLNHSNVLPTVEIVAAQYEEGVVESVLRVPHSARCRTGRNINQLIEADTIVNVSLEANCTLQSDDPQKCEGMEFTALALLTKETLPGIPLTRLMPLESIMVEALQAKTQEKTKMKKKTIKAKVVFEQDTPGKEPMPDEEPLTVLKDCPEGEHRNPETGLCVPDQGDTGTTEPLPVPTGPSDLEQATVTPTTDEPPPKTVLPDEHGQCPEGYILNDELNQCVKAESCPENQHFDVKLGKCVPDTEEKPEVPETAVGTSPAKDIRKTGEQTPAPVEPPEGAPSSLPATKVTLPATGDIAGEIEPEQPHDCPEFHHWDPEQTKCVPDEPIVERVKRIKAENEAKTWKGKAASWENHYMNLDKKYQQLSAKSSVQQATIDRLEKRVDDSNIQKAKDDVNLKDWRRRLEDVTMSREEYKDQAEKLQRKHEDLDRKYNEQLKINLELARKITAGNEDYLEVAKQKELLEAKLKKQKRLAKLVIKA
jgi:hypothetical protein